MSTTRKMVVGAIALVALGATVLLAIIFSASQPAAQAAAPVQAHAPVQAAAQAAGPAQASPAAQSNKSVEQYFDSFVLDFANQLGVSQDKLNAAFTATVSNATDQLVKDGKLTADMAAKIKEATKTGIKGLLPFVTGGMGNGEETAQPDPTNPKTLYLTALEDVARLLNTSRDEMLQQINATQSLVEMAQAQNVTAAKLQETILNSFKTQLDALVKAGKVTQAQADEAYKAAPNFIEKLINYKATENAPSPGNLKVLLGPGLEQVAKLFNMTRDQLVEQLKAGNQSLAEIAQSKNVEVAKVKQTLLDSFKSQLDAAVKAGKLTQAQADEAYRAAAAYMDKFISDKRPQVPVPGEPSPTPNSKK